MSSYSPLFTRSTAPELRDYKHMQQFRPGGRRVLAPIDLMQFHAALIRSRRKLLEEITGLQKLALAGKDDGANALVPGSTDPSMWEQLMALRDMDGKRSILRQIDAALERIAQKRYGLCVVDQAPISLEILEEIPWTARCSRCASKE
jgi:RNA polymerase-binding transcription factor DksA